MGLLFEYVIGIGQCFEGVIKFGGIPFADINPTGACNQALRFPFAIDDKPYDMMNRFTIGSLSDPLLFGGMPQPGV
jgi:hypothetical protein